ncbi:hypothetical protein [Mycobacterium avium]|uniref:Uncharacterized protein n=1 Tax=Mycobacterium avium (strain 104) TaxID=243243 RepID=A0A0H2ZW02_MYCA1|nr:hypothetical protein [Mycobacterium avium]ABK66008.1 hypothetical protein MAV_0267 [Mycobacterium avium 104]KDP09297.1 hypothetical protein MAV101_01345 [Mycobacterium avium subsp. hominissuis 101]MBZ4509058.1 hypothetical protein [Mycobacterium avium subsp. hominissuis]MCG3243021.1 hypothetical protein [Mycobacterium avium subsp. hominissuis]
MSTESIRAAAGAAFRAAHPDDRHGATIAGCRAAARVADPDHALPFTVGSLAAEETTRAREIDSWLDRNWSDIAP